MMLNQIKEDLQNLANPEKAKLLSRYFKTGKGEYAEGDVFLGITVPTQRSIAKKYFHLSIVDIKKLITSPIHEHRLTGLIILYGKFNQAGKKEQKEIYKFY